MRVVLIPLMILWAVAAVSVESRPQRLPDDAKNTDGTLAKDNLKSSTPNPEVSGLVDVQDGNSNASESGAPGVSGVTPEGQDSGNTTTDEPTDKPSKTSDEPTGGPTGGPTDEPTDEPTDPTEDPTDEPTGEPTENPTDEPTGEPTEEPTVEPTGEPTSYRTSTTTENTTGPTAAPSHHDKRSFDGWSFFGGILLTLGVMTVVIVALKYYKARTGGGSVGYNRAPDI